MVKLIDGYDRLILLEALVGRRPHKEGLEILRNYSSETLKATLMDIFDDTISKPVIECSDCSHKKECNYYLDLEGAVRKQ